MIVILQPSHGKNSANSILKLQSYWTDIHQIFTQCIAKSSPCDLFKLLNDRPIRFQTPEQRVKAVNFDVSKNASKLIGYHSNVP